jgi:cell division protein FtsA
MSHHSWSDEAAPDAGRATVTDATDRLRGHRWLGRVADLARRGQSAAAVPRPALNIAPEHLVVIVLISSGRVCATVAALHTTHGDKVVAHKAIDCVWQTLSESGKREAVTDAVRLACDSAGVEAYSIYLSMSDPSITSRLAVGWADPGDEVELTEHECQWALKRARDQATGADLELIDAIPVHWTVRDRSGEREVEQPVGERGSRLTCQALLVTARRGYREELASLVRGLDLELEGVVAQPIALYRGISGCLPKKGSTLVIDCGARCTSLLVRRRERLVHIETHPFGGDDLTAALVKRLSITAAQAEDLKRDLDISVRIDQRDNLVGQQFIWGDIRERHRLVGPGTAVLVETLGGFFRARAQELRDHGHLGQQGQVHLVGRASALGGLAVFLKDVFGLPVVLGSGQKNRDPSAELADVLISGLVCSAADLRRTHLAGQQSRIRKTASGVWSWLTSSMA